jgi:hypothetical protein
MAELLYAISSQLTKFIRVDKFLLSMPLQHKFANRYRAFYRTTLRQLIYIFTILLLANCSGNKTVDNSQTLKGSENKIQFPIKANFKNPDRPDEDTLIATVGKTDFLITPEGKLFWGQNPADTIHLQTDLIIENAFLHLKKDTLFIFYTDTDHEGATSKFEKINLTSRKRILTADIQGFNLGLPYIVDNFAYVTTIGVVGKLNLNTGKYAYQYFDLYDSENYSFNSFDTIIFKDNQTIFLSENYHSKHIDSLIINEKTGNRIIKK